MNPNGKATRSPSVRRSTTSWTTSTRKDSCQTARPTVGAILTNGLKLHRLASSPAKTSTTARLRHWLPCRPLKGCRPSLGQRPGHVQAPTPHQADPAIPEPMTQTTITSQVIESTRVLYSHRDGRVVTELTPDNRCAYSGQTLTEICAGESPARQLEVMPLSLALTLSHQYARRRYCTGPKAITSEQFDEMLNIMPPQLWLGTLGH